MGRHRGYTHGAACWKDAKRDCRISSATISLLRNVRDENKRLKAELDRVKMENQYLRNRVNTADRAQRLAIFQNSRNRRPSAAHVIGNTTGASGKVVFVDRGIRAAASRKAWR